MLFENNIAVSEGTLVDKRVAEGTLTVMLQGVREPYEFDLHIKTCYQKPKLKLFPFRQFQASAKAVPDPLYKTGLCSL